MSAIMPGNDAVYRQQQESTRVNPGSLRLLPDALT